MKNTIKIILAFTVIVTTLTFFGCRKKDDDSNYQPKGNYQPAGNYGNNTIQSQLFDNNEKLLWNNVNGDYEDTLKYSAITQSILDKGSVMVYMKWSTDTATWWTLPYSNSAAHFQVAFSVGMVRVCSDNPGGAYTFKFRVVVFTPASRRANPNVNIYDYKEVKKAFNLKD